MEYPLQGFVGAARSLGVRGPVLRPAGWRLAQAAHQDLRSMGMPQVNVLLVGIGSVTRSVVGMILRNREPPAATWVPGGRLFLPPVAQGGTMVLHEVGALSGDEQRQLFDWLEDAVGRAQVISTTSRPLLPQVRTGAFIEALLYRLNTVCLDVTP